LSFIFCTILYLRKCSYIFLYATLILFCSLFFTCETHYICFSLCFTCELAMFFFTMFSHVRVSAVTFSLCFHMWSYCILLCWSLLFMLTQFNMWILHCLTCEYTGLFCCCFSHYVSHVNSLSFTCERTHCVETSLSFYTWSSEPLVSP
jgi:hypothetical protein